ncbi:MAG: hypothetical protein A2Z83_08385 [Omnitrophica bacterium GWA2_52_8]|nr:MAG: hypothetical protein A2Z83_08385 [Omnitrophica bacterium GWA2_52_8]
MTETGKDFWKVCNTCKKPIGFRAVYYLCSVSTCRSKRTGLVFCCYGCYDGHLGFARHRSSSCEEAVSPKEV